MPEQQGAASFNPDDTSGLIDRLRGKITSVVVDYFTTKPADGSQPKKFVNVDVTYEGGGQKTTEHYLLGNGDEWAPNATKTGAIPTETGRKVWNKSDVIKWVTSLVNAGFPKALVGADLSVFVGTDVDVNRVTQEGSKYTDKKTGKERERTIMLVTKIYELPKRAQVAGGKVNAATAPTPATPPPVGNGSSDDANDGLLTEILIDVLSTKGNENGIAKDKLLQPIFIQATRKKLPAPVRKSIQERSQDDAFLATLVEGGLIKYDGATISPAA